MVPPTKQVLTDRSEEASSLTEGRGDNSFRVTLLIVFIAVPLANFLLSPILGNGEQFADDAEVRVAAAGYAFAIWGVIFTGMLGFSAFLVFGNERESRQLRKAIVALAVAGLASIAFVPISIYCSQTVGWIDIVVHLAALIFAIFQLRSHIDLHSNSSSGRWFFVGPSMYLGWISAATVISTALMANEWGVRLPEDIATGVATLVIVALGIVGASMTVKCDPVYGATVCWALVAVGVKQVEFPTLQYVAWSAAFVLGVVIALNLVLRRPIFYAFANVSKS